MNTTVQETVEQAKSGFLRAKARLVKCIITTPEDKLNWSPSPSSRTPLHQAAHCAMSINYINQILDGHPFTISTPAEADVLFRKLESEFKTREKVMELLEKNCDNYLTWLDNLTEEKFNSSALMPFNLGMSPISFAITLPAMHTMEHCAQLDYMQTIYGDLDWHMD